jgi:hypothetical protein
MISSSTAISSISQDRRYAAAHMGVQLFIMGLIWLNLINPFLRLIG